MVAQENREARERVEMLVVGVRVVQMGLRERQEMQVVVELREIRVAREQVELMVLQGKMVAVERAEQAVKPGLQV